MTFSNTRKFRIPSYMNVKNPAKLVLIAVRKRSESEIDQGISLAKAGARARTL
jgi:hypothetical protein